MLVSFLLRNLEIILSLAGLAVIIAVPPLLPNNAIEPWMTTALVATLVGFVHGMIFWLVRRRQRIVRQQTIIEIQEMLHDVIKNQLAIIFLNIQLADSQQNRIHRVGQSINTINVALDSLSEESLKHWGQHYHGALRRLHPGAELSHEG